MIPEHEWLKAHHASQKRNAEAISNTFDALEGLIVALAAPLPPQAFTEIMARVKVIKDHRHDEGMGQFATFLRLEELGWVPNDEVRFGSEHEPWVKAGKA